MNEYILPERQFVKYENFRASYMDNHFLKQKNIDRGNCKISQLQSQNNGLYVIFWQTMEIGNVCQ